MSSLFEMLFDTMPLAGAAGALAAKNPIPLRSNTVGELSQVMSYVPLEDAPTKLQYQCKGTMTVPSDEADRRSRRLWSFNASTSTRAVGAIRCRVSGDRYETYTVLDRLEFGNGMSSFNPEIELRFPQMPEDRKPTRLRLVDQNCLATFVVANGFNPEKNHWLWPLAAKHDIGLLTVFVFDVDLATGNAIELTGLAPSHADQPEVDKFMAACRRLRSVSFSSDSIAQLFTDNLWNNTAQDAVVGVAAKTAAGAAGALGPLGGLAAAAIPVRAAVARVAVCCCLTLHKEGDDFTPGNPAWAARIDPQIMVRCTMPLKELSAGVRMVRPSVTTVEGNPDEDGEVLGCHEMNKEMNSLLVSDTNQNNKIVPNVPFVDAPAPYWSNIFNYHRADPYNNGFADVQVVHRDRNTHRTIDGAIKREGDENGRVTRYPRQAMFDNLHIAPTMRVPAVTQWTSASGGLLRSLPESDRAKWKLDEVWMAPICAHDCFHMHWRWTDDVGAHIAAYGWKGGKPYAKGGFPMVQENQNVYVNFQNEHSVIYSVKAAPKEGELPIPANEWQIVLHHGAAYVVEVKSFTEQVRTLPEKGDNLIPFGSVGSGFHPSVVFQNGAVRVGSGHWSVFYWNMRYYADDSLGGYQARERTQIIDTGMLLHEKTTVGRP